MWSWLTNWRQVGQFSSDIILFFNSRGISFLEFRTDTWDVRFINLELFSSSTFLCLPSNFETESNLSWENKVSSWICFCIRIISFFILDSRYFFPWREIPSFSDSEVKLLFSSRTLWRETSLSSEFFFDKIRFWYSIFRLFVSFVSWILFSFSKLIFTPYSRKWWHLWWLFIYGHLRNNCCNSRTWRVASLLQWLRTHQLRLLEGL